MVSMRSMAGNRSPVPSAGWKSSMTNILLRPGREKSVLRRHPWIFSGAIQHVEGEPVAGETVDLFASSREFLARAAYSPTSQIRARVWSFEDEPVDAAFFRVKIRAAV